MILFDRLFRLMIRHGPLSVIDAKGRVRIYGTPARAIRPLTIRLADAALPWAVVRNPALAMGEAYMDGRLVVEDGDIADFADLIGYNLAGMPIVRFARGCGDRRGSVPRSTAGTGVAAQGATSRIIMISRTGSTTSSLTAIANIAALISTRPICRSIRRKNTRRPISPPSCCFGPVSACWTSVAAGAEWRSI